MFVKGDSQNNQIDSKNERLPLSATFALFNTGKRFLLDVSF